MGMLANLYVKLGLKNDQFNKNLDKSQKKAKGFGSAMKKIGGMVAGAFAFGAIVSGIKKVIKANAEFEQSMASLSAITGATGDDLKFYEEQAIKMGSTTTLSASQVAKAFELVGSAKPDLLKSKEALAAVTQEAIALAEAAGMELPDAAKALTGAMNQFGLPAAEAGRVINVLAAGSKEGSADINSLNESMKNVGAVASSAGLSIEQTVGALETLGEKQLKGAEAGTALRGVIMRLQAAGVGYESGVFNLSDALNEANNQVEAKTSSMEKDAKMTQLFGRLNITAGKIMMQNVDKYEQLSTAVTDTNVAYEQQAKNTNTLKASWKGLMSAIEGIMLSFRSSNGILKSMVDKVADFLNRLRQAIPQIKKFIKGSEPLQKVWELISASIQRFWQHFKDVFSAAFKIVIHLANAFISLYNESEGFRKVLAAIKTAFQAAFAVGKAFLETMVGGFKTLVDWISSGFKGDVWGDFWDETKKVWDDAIKEIGENARENFKKAIEAEPLDLIVVPKIDLSKAETNGKLEIPAEKIEIKADLNMPTSDDIDIDKSQISNLLTEDMLKSMRDREERMLKDWKDFTDAMEQSVESFAANVVADFAYNIGEMIAAGNFSGQELGRGLLRSIGDFLVKMGEMMIAFGIANSAFAASLKSLATGNPAAAAGLIASGAAMVAIGSAISSSASNMASTGDAGGMSISTGSYSGASLQSVNQQERDITLNAVLSGDNIYLSNQRNIFKRNIIG